MIRRILLFIGLLFPSFLFSQPYGNEWINYAQPYYKFKVAETGIYRIHKQALINSGIPIDAINPKNFQIFGNEKELFIYIDGEEDGSFDENDYIEFVGQKNDGWLDSLLYENPADMLNPNYSLINDTITYYLTWNSSTINRRVTPESGQNYDTYPTSPFCWVTKQSVFNANYLGGKRAGQIQNPLYTVGEGYGLFRSSGNYTIEFNTTQRITGLSAPEATFKTVFASANNPAPGIPEGNHHLRVQVQNQVVFDEIFLGYENFNVQYSIDPLTLSNASQVIFGSVNDIGLTANDSYAIGFAELKFAHNYNFENEGFFVFEAATNAGFEKLKVEFDSFTGSNPVVYAFGNSVYRNSPTVDGQGFRFLIPQNGENAIKCVISSNAQIKLVENIELVNSNGFFTDFSEQNTSNAFVIITENTVAEAAQSYAVYRNFKFNSLVVMVDELYDQYGGGVEKHPLSIKRFMADLLQNWDEAPEYLFLFGKSIHPAIMRNDPEIFASCLVPTIGSPASDNLFTAGLNGTILQTAVPTGRLAAKSKSDGIEYLNKVILFESQQPDSWMKHMLHFGGGGNTIEQTTFANYLSQYEITVSDTSFGARVSTVLKNTSAPIQINVSEEITNRINSGVSMMTFFGHGTGSGFDINIDAPENYENYGKYPLILASSCFVGNIHTIGITNSEKFVLIPEKGSIAYIASTTNGVAAYLHAFNKKFYQHLFQSDYGTSIGENLSRAVTDIQGKGSDLKMIANCLEMTLHGDPSLVLNTFEKPDFATANNRIYFEPEELTADVDSFKVKIPMDNLARATHQIFNVELIRHLPNSSGDSIYVKSVTGLLNTDTLIFKLAALHEMADGLNTFDITLDVYGQVDEIDNIGNNKVFGKEYYVKSSQIVPVYPYDLAIIDEQQPYLSASTGDLKSTTKTYHFQISQQADFGNPTEGEVSISGGVVKWQVPFILNPETVYYWRVAEASDAAEGNWRASSFEYIPNKTGWGQASPNQFNNNQFDLLNYVTPLNELSFLEGSKTLTCKLFGGQPNFYENEVMLDLDQINYGGCPGDPYIFVMVFDENTLEPWGNNYQGANPENEFGNVICSGRSRVEYYFAFRQNSAEQLDALYNMLSVEIPNGKHMLVYTYTFSRFDLWSEYNPALFTLFQNLGSTLIDVTAPEQVPFIFYVQKGMTETVVEEMGQTKFDTLFVSVPLPITGNIGKVHFSGGGFTSEIQEISWNFTEPDTHDKFEFEIHQEQSATPIFETDNPSGSETTPLEADPNLQISGSIILSDTADFTPLQFEDFRLFYTPVGDVSLNPNETFSFESDTVQEGQSLLLNMAISNPTPYPMDSLTIRYSIVDIYNNSVRVVTRKIDSLLPVETLIDELEIATLGLSGKNRLVYQINPLSTEGLPEQPEQHRFNNEISIPFFVKTDDTQPILDVVFDGIHIMDGEIVSPKPNVVISLKDDNDFLVFEEDADTSNIVMFITTPEGIQSKINYGINDDGNISWKFDTNKNRFRINYVPDFKEDGKYHLLIQARDKSGNMSGTNDYEITFEVINKSAITQVLNYPNPFTTKTYFVFTLTGDRVPDVFTIRIYTVSGKIVKEIHKQELGNIHIGNNITDYYWDGTDNYGGRLANGVYFYQVTVEFNDAIMESIDTNADQYFKSGMGKMYLMR